MYLSYNVHIGSLLISRMIDSSFFIMKRKGGGNLFEWNESIQKMIDWIECNITNHPSLLEMSKQIGYSPYYCSSRFHAIVGMSIKSYISGRRLARATLEIRDTNIRILDIAIKYGYSSHETLTRAFLNAYGCTPSDYRKNPVPIALSNRQVVFNPEHYYELYGSKQGGNVMSKTCLTDANIRIEFIPAHKYIGIWDDTAHNYSDFWKSHDCDEVCGIIESLRNVSDPIVGCHMAGWNNKDGQRKYFYGLGVPTDYDGPVLEGFEIRSIPESYYIVFFHPPFDYLKDCGEVMYKVEKLAWNYDLKQYGLSDKNLNYTDNRHLFEWNEDNCPCYQRHYPEVLGYELLRPIKKVK